MRVHGCCGAPHQPGRSPEPGREPRAVTATPVIRPGPEGPSKVEAPSIGTVELGQISHPSAVTGHGPPLVITTGQTAAFQVTETLPTGEGLLRGTPIGPTATVVWDFIVEID